MPLIETKGAASAQGFGEFAKTGGPANYIEDVFSTWLYTGNGSTQTITNGIDLAGKGGLVWGKDRNATNGHYLTDTARGTNSQIRTHSTAAETTATTALTAFNTNGFSVGSNAYYNQSSTTYASWTFRKQPKFFDVVTYTGNDTSRSISHSLGSVPGCIIVKNISQSGFDWVVYHRSNGATKWMKLNATDAVATNATYFPTDPTSTTFAIGSGGLVNNGGDTYVAYIFAHDAGGFGLTGTDNVISCGSYTGTGSTLSVTLGYEPQWVMIKRTDTTADWQVIDNMRGWIADGVCQRLVPNTSAAEAGPTGSTFLFPTATGFGSAGSSAIVNASGGTYIYIAIRRGPMKTPTTGTSVFLPTARSGNGTADTKVTGASWPVDTLWISRRTGGGLGVGGFTDVDRLRGAGYNNPNSPVLFQNSTDSEQTSFSAPGLNGASGVQNQYILPSGGGYSLFNTSGVTYIDYLFARAPGFFDVVCYTGNDQTNRAINHNLSASPELIILKSRSTSSWFVYSNLLQASRGLVLNETGSQFDYSTNFAPGLNSATQFGIAPSVGTAGNVNVSGINYVAYLFASCPGVSKVGSYTGTGSTLQIDCGFTGGARFVLIKRTDSTGDWYCWDSSRGIVSGNDSYLVLNSTAAEVTNTDWVDTYSAGFELSNAAGNNVNINGASYIFLSVA